LAFLLILADPTAGSAQQSSQDEPVETGRAFQSSPYLTLDSWIYDYVDLLVARGRLTGLMPLVRPYRRLDVARAILEAEGAGRLSAVELEWAGDIKLELEHEVGSLSGAADVLTIKGRVALGLEGVSQEHRDLLRPEGDAHLFPTFDFELRGDAPALAGAFRLHWTNQYLNDPQFPNRSALQFRACDPFVDQCAYRVEEAYVEVQIPYVRVFFGRLYRNWGLPRLDGLLVSNYAYSYDHLGYRFGSDRIALTGMYAPFNDFSGDTARHFASHRLDWQLRHNLVLSLGESVVYGGPNRRIAFNLINPVGIWEIMGNPNGGDRNALGTLEAWWRPWDNLVTYGAFLIDNTSVGDEEQGKKTGFNQYAAELGVQIPMLGPNLGLRADFTVVSSLAYRSRVDFFEYYAVGQAGFGIGLAQDKTDMILVHLLADWFVRPRLLIKPGLQLIWKGEDNITDPWPDDAFVGHPALLVGVVEKQIRPYLGGRWHSRYADVRWDLGLALFNDKDHLPSDWTVDFVGSVWAEAPVSF
jgi:hypothetical protein